MIAKDAPETWDEVIFLLAGLLVQTDWDRLAPGKESVEKLTELKGEIRRVIAKAERLKMARDFELVGGHNEILNDLKWTKVS